MADTGEEQYEYPGDQSISEQEAAPEGILAELGFPSNLNIASLKKLAMDRRVYLPVGMMVGIFLISHLVGMLAGSQDKAAAAPKPAVAEQQAATQKVKADLVAQQQATQAQSAQTNQQMTEIRETAKSNESSINQLTENIKTLASSIQAQSTDVIELRSQMNDISQMVKKLMPKMKAAKGAKAAPKLVYDLRAVIDGRAWIRDNNMKAYTVRVGDALPQLGKVVSIDPSGGDVRFSSGEVITYGSNDS